MGVHHQAPSKPFHKRPVVWLILAAVASFALIALVLRPSAHDPLWWKHAGIVSGPGSSVNGGPQNVVFSDDGTVLEGKKASHEDGVHIVGGHDGRGLPPKPDGQQHPVDAGHQDKSSKPTLRPLVQGVDYISDYDVDKVVVDPDPVAAQGQKVYFNYIDPETNPMPYAMKYLSNKPRILHVQDFLSSAECDTLVQAASKRMFRSQVAPMQGSKASAVNDVRTSSQAWLPAGSAEVKPIVDRILKLTGMPAGSNEELQILRYELTQKYDAHNDYFDPKMYGAQSTNRAITVFLYLSDVEDGGHTQFPRADGKGPTWDYTSCTKGLRVKPRKGQIALFYDMDPLGNLDPFSLHGGCPVKKGVKWGGTLWLRVPTGGK